MKFTIDIRLFLMLTVAFVLFTAIGTLSHEYGHIIVAKSLGYETTLHYGSMDSQNPTLDEKIVEIHNANKKAIENKTGFVQQAEYEAAIEKQRSNELLIALGGPFQTTLTGTIGLLILSLRGRKLRNHEFTATDWLATFLALFWLRQVFNLVMSVGGELIAPNGSYFGGDEEYVSDTLNLWSGTFSTILGVIGAAIAVFVVFKRIPHQFRPTFILSGFIGGIFGFVLWMDIVGPAILP